MRERLTNAVATAVINCGYSFFYGAQDRIPCEMDAVPAAWLLPAEVSQVTGKDQGVITYKFKLILIELDKRYSSKQKESLFAQMETHAMKIYRSLCEDKDIQAVSSVSWSPSEFCYTPSADVSLDIEMKVDIVFNKHKFD